MKSTRKNFKDDAERYFTTEQIGETRSLTPEGFLLCRNVPIARTGEMLYMPQEIGNEVEAGKDGIVRIARDADELFSADTIASFEGKPVTNGHPSTDVDPTNWRIYAKGVTQNVRRGSGEQSEMLLADLLIQDSAAIEAVNDGKREVSCGYSADYEQLAPGNGRQRNVIGNHVALVASGRCGDRCSIQDEKGVDMSVKKRTWIDRVMTAFKAQDEAALQEALEGAQGEGTQSPVTVHVHQTAPAEPAAEVQKDEEADPLEAIMAAVTALADRMDKLEAGAKPAAAADTTDDEQSDDVDEDEDKPGTQDSAALVTSFQKVKALAEILAPGIKLPTMDAKATRKATIDSMCVLRKKALTQAASTDGGAAIIGDIVGGKPNIGKMTCDAAAILFNAAAKATAATNKPAAFTQSQSGRKTLDTDEQNKANADFWNKKR